MDCGGGRTLAGAIDALIDELAEYYGAINELRAGLVPESMPDKPEALILLEKLEATGLPLVAGGLMDQPHIWILEMGVVLNERTRWEALFAASEPKEGA